LLSACASTLPLATHAGLWPGPLAAATSTLLLATHAGLWPGPLATATNVIDAIRAEAHASDYEAVLLEQWSYRLIALIFRITRKTNAQVGSQPDGPSAMASGKRVGSVSSSTAAESEGMPQDEPLRTVDAGPVVITTNGDLRCVSSWRELSESDRAWTEQRVSARNAERLARLHLVGGRFSS
jgi:hypothetical protein